MQRSATSQVKQKRAPALSRRGFYLLFILLYALPYGAIPSKNPQALLLCSLLGLCGTFFLIRLLESKMQNVAERILRLRLYKVQRLREEALHREALVEEIKRLQLALEESKEEQQKTIDRLQSSLLEVREQHLRKEALLSEYHHTISEQRMILEKRQNYIGQLETKVRDLMGEIRSLLHLEPTNQLPAPPSLLQIAAQDVSVEQILPEDKGASSYDYSLHLARYLELARNQAGVDHFGYLGGKTPRFLDGSADRYALDLRPLFDAFRQEATGIIFIYSVKEERFLFVHPRVKTELGWHPERFQKEWEQLVTMGYPEWKRRLYKLSPTEKAEVALKLRTRSGEERPYFCLMGAVPDGPFSSNVIGILFTLQKV